MSRLGHASHPSDMTRLLIQETLTRPLRLSEHPYWHGLKNLILSVFMGDCWKRGFRGKGRGHQIISHQRNMPDFFPSRHEHTSHPNIREHRAASWPGGGVQHTHSCCGWGEGGGGHRNYLKYLCAVINRLGVAGAVLKQSFVLNRLSRSSFSSESLRHCLTQTVRARELTFW